MSEEHDDFGIAFAKNAALSTGIVLALALLLYLVKSKHRLSITDFILMETCALLLGAMPAALFSKNDLGLRYGYSVGTAFLVCGLFMGIKKIPPSKCCNKNDTGNTIENRDSSDSEDSRSRNKEEQILPTEETTLTHHEEGVLRKFKCW